MTPAFSRAWFATFGRPDPAETEREVEFLLSVLPRPPASVLDVPCGFGRHALALGARGYRVTGVELDPEVAGAARAAGVDVREVDMRRLDEVSETFDAVICMWASFGWFDDETNAAVLAGMAARVVQGGVVLLDLYDHAFFRTREGTRLNRGVRDTKTVVDNRLRTTLEYPGGERDEFEWRLYELGELHALGQAAGLDVATVCAGYDPAATPTGETPRMQAVFRRRRSRLSAKRTSRGGSGEPGGSPTDER